MIDSICYMRTRVGLRLFESCRPNSTENSANCLTMSESCFSKWLSDQKRLRNQIKRRMLHGNWSECDRNVKVVWGDVRVMYRYEVWSSRVRSTSSEERLSFVVWKKHISHFIRTSGNWGNRHNKFSQIGYFKTIRLWVRYCVISDWKTTIINLISNQTLSSCVLLYYNNQVKSIIMTACIVKNYLTCGRNYFFITKDLTSVRS